MPTLKPKSISQNKLKRLYELEALVKEYNDLKNEIVDLAEEGLPCQPGRFSCMLKVTSSTSIPWKAEFIKVRGESEAERIAKRYKGNTTRRKLIVTDRDNPAG